MKDTLIPYKEVQSAKKLVESVGYTVSKKKKDSRINESSDKLTVGDKFKNQFDTVITILEPDKQGRYHYKTNRSDDVRIGSEDSILHMLEVNGYTKI